MADGCGNNWQIAFTTHLLCDVPEGEQSACNRNRVFGNRYGEVWHMSLGDHSDDDCDNRQRSRRVHRLRQEAPKRRGFRLH